MKLPNLKALNADVALHCFLNGAAQQLLYHRDGELKARILALTSCFAMFSLCWYGQGFHLQSGVVPNLAFNVVQSAFDTLTKLEKKVAE